MRVFATLVALLVCGGAAYAQPPTPLQLSDVFELQTANDPQLSPNGARIVYVRQFADIMTDKRYSNLWSVAFDGSDPRPLTSGKRNDTNPRWSPDGKRVMFSAPDDTGVAQLFVRWIDSPDIAQITHVRYAAGNAVWSPDGTQIVYSSFVPGAAPAVIAPPTPPKGATWADPARVVDRLSYRFNGIGYLETGFTHLFVVSSFGGTPRQISVEARNHIAIPFGGSDPVWTPDGRYVIASSSPLADNALDPLETDIYAYDVARGGEHRLTSRPGPDNSPALSKDGKRIAYSGFDDHEQGYQVKHLYVMDRDGGNAHAIAGNFDRDVDNPRWSDDGRSIYAVFDDRGNTQIARFELDGRHTVVARNLGSGAASAFSGGDFSVAGSRLAYVTSTPTIPADVAAGEIGRDARVVTHVNADLLAQRTLGAVEEIAFTNPNDQRAIEGWIIKPPGFDPTKKYPLILEIHGGPFANYGDRFDIEKQLMAAPGYVVLYTNPRGSTSYGAEFGNLIHHAYPGEDLQDLLAGVDAVIARGYIDSTNLFVTGGSGGGVLTAWTIGHTDRFRAAVAAYPVINWYSWVLTADIPGIGLRYWFPGPPWDFLENYESRSLLSVVKNVKTPTMILTGESDYRTPMSESEQYYAALKILGVESVLVRVPGEPHGIRLRPSHHMQKIDYIRTWFERHRAPAAS